MIARLDGGLVMRRATTEDAARVADFNAVVHGTPEHPHDEWIHAWTLELMNGTHPTTGPGDFLIVEDGDRVVSSVCLISQRWSYGGIPFGVGRPEIVGTLEEYRRRGLVRRQMDEVHRWSAERGELVQAITGIPWFYRQFGYEFALDLAGGRATYPAHVPKQKEGQSEPFRLRAATAEDVPLIARLTAAGQRRWLIVTERSEDDWRFEIGGRDDRMGSRFDVVEDAAGEPVGYVAVGRRLNGGSLNVAQVELDERVSWLAFAPTLLRALAERGRSLETAAEPFNRIVFRLSTEHPIYMALRGRLTADVDPYAFYLRVPDLPAFVRRIAPVLESRLARSVARGHSGELLLSFYRDGLRLRLDGGRLVDVETFRPPQRMPSAAWLPDLTFLQLLFGRRSFDELRETFPDAYSRGDEAPVLLDALFPKSPSYAWPVD